jgi:glycosyltransferase involved in cell wall biosynthesis
MSISCVICAFNEADRIGEVLKAVEGHPDLAEVIVVDDGSTDATRAVVAAFPGVRLIALPQNRGKTLALGAGAAAAQGDWLMLLDADLRGLTARDVSALAQPVLTGRADVTLSLRANSLALYRGIGLDFVSGERVLPKALVTRMAAEAERLPRWGGEAFINELIIAQGLRLTVVNWPTVYHTPKAEKTGPLEGTLADLRMVRDAASTLSLWGLVRQNLRLLKLVTPRPAARGGLPQAA